MRATISAMVRIIPGAFLIVFMLVTSSAADIYRYVDDNGVICYTDAPLNKKAVRVVRSDISTSPKEGKTAAPEKDFSRIVEDKANKYDLDPSLLHAVIKTESNGNPRAVSRKGAMGLMQLMPTTADDLDVRNPFDPEENIDGGTRYLKYLIEKFGGDLTLALAAYNAGPKTVERTRSVPQIPETKQYVKRVLSLYKGKTVLPVSSAQGSASTVAAPVVESIYRIVKEDGTVLFTNSPFYKKNPRF
ncbi:MAG: transglycosylase SLT domain-containing protein [Nitrospirae bacterium]|nr:transglycosylase SLT domain-containing protein [Nitrospirota bacterium]